MKTKCLSCGGPTTTKMQNGGLTTGAKKVLKQGPIKTIKTIRKALNKLTTRKTAPGCFGADCTKMQAGGSLPKAQNGRNVIPKRKKITGPIPTPTPKKTETGFGKGPINTIKKGLNKLRTRKNKPGCFGASCGKMQNGGFIGGTSVGKGRNITAKAAARKVAKGKGMMTYEYGNTDAPGTGNNKGAYVKFAKDQESNPYGAKTFKGRPRSVMQKGGVKK